MDALKNLDTVVEIFAQVDISLQDLTLTDTEKSLLWPLTEPIKCTASDEGWETSQSGAENFSKRRHSDNHVSVLYNTAQVSSEHVHLCDSDTFFDTLVFTDLEDWLHVFSPVQVWHITTVEYIVDIFEHLFINDLCVNE